MSSLHCTFGRCEWHDLAQVAVAEAQTRKVQEELNDALRDKARLAEELVAAQRQLNIVRESNEQQARHLGWKMFCWSTRLPCFGQTLHDSCLLWCFALCHCLAGCGCMPGALLHPVMLPYATLAGLTAPMMPASIVGIHGREELWPAGGIRAILSF